MMSSSTRKYWLLSCGDGKLTAGEDAQDPVVAFPGHLAPNGLLFYTGNQFPEKYKNGAFIAFHGSWNRAPEPQKGYFVVFQPFKDGKPSGDWEVFADNFSGGPELTASGRAKYRPLRIGSGTGWITVCDRRHERYDLGKSAIKSKNAALARPGLLKISYEETGIAGACFYAVIANAKACPNKKPAASSAKVAMQAVMDRGKKVYLEQCLACHQADAGGVQNMNPP